MAPPIQPDEEDPDNEIFVDEMGFAECRWIPG